MRRFVSGRPLNLLWSWNSSVKDALVKLKESFRRKEQWWSSAIVNSSCLNWLQAAEIRRRLKHDRVEKNGVVPAGSGSMKQTMAVRHTSNGRLLELEELIANKSNNQAWFPDGSVPQKDKLEVADAVAHSVVLLPIRFGGCFSEIVAASNALLIFSVSPLILHLLWYMSANSGNSSNATTEFVLFLHFSISKV